MNRTRTTPLPPPPAEEEVRRQFVLDAPRMDLFLDKVQLTSTTTDPEQWYDKLVSLVSPKPAALTAAEMCCQTVLAPYFSTARENLVECGPDVHLVDGGRQKVVISVAQRRLVLEKPFEVVAFSESGDAVVMFVVTLTLSVDLGNRTCEETWTRNLIVEKDWCFVEILSEDDELGLGVSAGATEVGLSAVRLGKRRDLLI
jgi:hypothetical protein